MCAYYPTSNDPIVLTHARALLTSAPGGVNAYLDADLREPGKILSHPDLAATLDLSQPVGLLLVAVLHFVREDEHPQELIDKLAGALAPGSFVVASHATWEFLPGEAIAQLTANNPDGRFQARTGARFAELLSAFDLVEPGIVSVAHWHAEGVPGQRPSAEDVACYGAVAGIR
ncbi:SAM-dependent methyltransferase [Dactylosporangium sp. NPDC051484]|uniref:SAM-dependent methyltransferase n=1 Tax=Dactylosporangium sp. NPDC051484 TaxID=3154942 RepID=UPI00344EBE94